MLKHQTLENKVCLPCCCGKKECLQFLWLLESFYSLLAHTLPALDSTNSANRVNSKTMCGEQDQQYITIQSSNPTPKYSLNELKIYKNICSHKICTQVSVYSSFIHNYQRMKQSRFTSIDEWINML